MTCATPASTGELVEVLKDVAFVQAEGLIVDKGGARLAVQAAVAYKAPLEAGRLRAAAH